MLGAWHRRRAGRRRRGFTLVEVMVSVLVLAVLAIGGAALIYRCRADIVIQQTKRAAIERANQQMETLMRSPNAAFSYTNLSLWIGTPRVTNVVLNGVSNYTMRTTVANGGAAADGCLRITVSVAYGRGAAADTVSIETLRSK